MQLSEIIRCKSDNNYTTFYLENGQKTLVSKTLKYFADMLKEHRFLRIHQSHLIDTKYIKEFIKSDGGHLVLKDKSNIPVSIRKRNEVIESLDNLKELLFLNFPYFPYFLDTKKVFPFLRRLCFLGGRRDSNPRHSVPQTDTLTN